MAMMHGSEMYGTYGSTRVTVDDYYLGVIDSRRMASVRTIVGKKLGANQLADGK